MLLDTLVPKCYSMFLEKLSQLPGKPTEVFWPKSFDEKDNGANISGRWESCANKTGDLIIQKECFHTLAGKLVAPIKMKDNIWILKNDNDELLELLTMFQESTIVNLSSASSDNIFNHLMRSGFANCVISPLNISALCHDNINVIQKLEPQLKMFLLSYIVNGGGSIAGLPLLPLRSGKWAFLESDDDGDHESNCGTQYYYFADKDAADCIPKEFERILAPHYQGHDFWKKMGHPGVLSLEKNLPSVIKECYLTSNTARIVQWCPGVDSLSFENVKSLWQYLNKLPSATIERDYDGLFILPNVPLQMISQQEIMDEEMFLVKIQSCQKLLYTSEEEDAGMVSFLKKIGVTPILSYDPKVNFSFQLQAFVQELKTKNVTNILKEMKEKNIFFEAHLIGHEEDLINFLYKQRCSQGQEYLKNLKLIKNIHGQRNSINNMTVYATGSVKIDEDILKTLTNLGLIVLQCSTVQQQWLARDVFSLKELSNDVVLPILIKHITNDPANHQKEIVWVVNNFPRHCWISQLANKKFLPSNGKYFLPSELFFSGDEESSLLFQGESYFFIDEDSPFKSVERELCGIGLKMFNNATKRDLMIVARSVHLTNESIPNDKLELLLKIAQQKNILYEFQSLKLLPSMKQRPTSYPKDLPWISDGRRHAMNQVLPDRFANVAGAICYISDINFSKYAMNQFPTTDMLLKQLTVLVTHQCKMGEIFTLIAEEGKFETEKIKKYLKELKKWILTDQGFKSPEEVSLNRKDEKTFSPYIFLPVKEIIDKREFYTKLGLRPRLEKKDVEDICSYIQEDFEGKPPGENWVKKSETFLHCLERIKDEASILKLPVNLEGLIKFFPSTECYYDDIFKSEKKMGLKDLPRQKVVSLKGLTPDLAREMKLRPLTELVLNIEDFGDDSIEQFGQVIDVPTRIREALREYSEGSIFKEKIQNAEDADASKVAFYLDDSDNSQHCSSLLGDGLKDCQGPAIWIFNDEKFTDQDFNNLIKLGGATKKEDIEKIGSFGIGFNSVYHFTDTPTIVSGNYFVMFDPSLEHLPKNLLRNPAKPGIKINLTMGPQKLVDYKDQFLPFKIPEFGLDLSYNPDGIHYDGTVIRLPLRTSKNEKLSTKCYSKDNFIQMEQFFNEEKFNYMPFLSTVGTLQMITNSSATGEKMIINITKHEDVQSSNIKGSFKKNMMKYIQSTELRNAPFKSSIISQKVTRSKLVEDENHLFVVMKVLEKDSKAFKLTTSESGKENGLQPSVGLAISLQKSTEDTKFNVKRMKKSDGLLYSHLPLNIPSGHNFHINAGFALSSNRKQLHTEESMYGDDTRSKWNDVILSEEIPKAFVSLLNSLKLSDKIIRHSFDDIWPAVSDLGVYDAQDRIPSCIYQNIAETDKELFQSEMSTKWACWKNCFVTQFDLFPAEIEKICKELLSEYLKNGTKDAEIVRLSSWSLQGLRNHGLEGKTFTEKRFYLEAFLPRYHILEKATREKILKHLLKTCNEKEVLEKLKKTPCVPTATGNLKKASELVEKKSEIENLYLVKEDVVASEDFFDYFLKLRQLGMKHQFDVQILDDRLDFLKKEHEQSKELFSLSQNLLKHSHSLWRYNKKELKEIFKDHKYTSFVPATDGNIYPPDNVWMTSVEDYVSFSRHIVQMHQDLKSWSPGFHVDSEFFHDLGLKKDVTVEDVVNQLVHLAYEDKVKVKPKNKGNLIGKNLGKLAEIHKHENLDKLRHQKLIYDEKQEKFYSIDKVTFET